ncbi:MAG: hypothetical protein QM753_13765 [Thermomicrobiales bacterium]
MPIWHRPFLILRAAPHLLSMAITLMAVVALPLCLPHESMNGLDADERTITESRDVVEIVTTPGIHLLHQEAGMPVADTCDGDRCVHGAGAGASHSGEPRISPDDLGQRVAILPHLPGVDDSVRAAGDAESDAAWLEAPALDESPPPRTVLI